MADPAPGVVICGGWGGSNVGFSLFTSAEAEGLRPAFCDTAMAQSRIGLLNKLFWRLGRIAPHPSRLEKCLARRSLAGACVITTGLAPVRAAALRDLRDRGCVTLHYSTDDPWSRGHSAAWHHRALIEYDIVYTPRRTTEPQLRELGCRDVRYLPFGFDERLFLSEPASGPGKVGIETLFVGGADAERAGFLRAFVAAGGDPVLVGGYWDRWPDLAPRWLGHCPPQRILDLTRSALINLILVRRSNRDGHTMRSIEAGAIGGCLLVEDTEEHRTIFGGDGACVRYFASPQHAASLARSLLDHPAERERMARAVRNRIRSEGHSYADRLRTMMLGAGEIRQRREAAEPA